MGKIQVLMSTYNGEKYIKQQIDSIINQDYEDIEILIRDDGSYDSTVDIITMYSKKYSNIKYILGENIGVVESFFELMKNADKTCKYFALSDQDDYWLCNKLSVAISMIDKDRFDLPILYCSKPKLVDENLKDIKIKYSKDIKIPSFNNAMIENINTGCTCVFNIKLLEKVLYKIPDKDVIMHDWWLYLVACAFGKVIYDEDSYVLYRQHINNQIGQSSTKIEKWIKRIRNFRKNINKISMQLKMFLESFSTNLDNSKLIILNRFFESKKSIKNKLRFIKDKQICRQNALDMFIFKMLYIFDLL